MLSLLRLSVHCNINNRLYNIIYDFSPDEYADVDRFYQILYHTTCTRFKQFPLICINYLTEFITEEYLYDVYKKEILPHILNRTTHLISVVKSNQVQEAQLHSVLDNDISYHNVKIDLYIESQFMRNLRTYKAPEYNSICVNVVNHRGNIRYARYYIPMKRTPALLEDIVVVVPNIKNVVRRHCRKDLDYTDLNFKIINDFKYMLYNPNPNYSISVQLDKLNNGIV